MRRDQIGILTEAHCQELVPHREQAGRFQADDRYALLRKGEQRVQRAPRLRPRPLDLAGRQIGTAAAKRRRT